MTYRAVVHLGTPGITVTCEDAAAAGPPHVLRVRTALHVDEAGQLSLARASPADPAHELSDFTAWFGEGVPVQASGYTFSADESTATFLRLVLGRVTADRGEAPSDVVLVLPSTWPVDRRERLRGMLDQVGVPVATTTAALRAASAYAARQPVASGERLLICDFGAGPLEVTVVEHAAAGPTQVASADIHTPIAGTDLDEALLAQVFAQLGPELSRLDPAAPTTAALVLSLREDCRAAKEQLSRQPEAQITVALPEGVRQVMVSAAALDAALGPQITGALAEATQSLRWAGAGPETVQHTVLVGGNTQLPLVHRLVRQALPGPAFVPAETQTVVRPAPPQPKPPGEPGPPNRPNPPNRKILLAAGAAIVVVLILVGILVLPGEHDPLAAVPPPASNTPTVEPTTPATTPSDLGLPTSAPLASSELVVPRGHLQTSRLYVADASQPGSLRRLPATGLGGVYGPTISPDRRSIVYLDIDRGALRTIAPDGTGERPLFDAPPGCGQIGHASWNPIDPQLIVLQCITGSRDRLVVANLAGQIVRELTTPWPWVDDPAVSSDGTKVAFWASSAAKPNGGGIVVMDLAGSTPPKLITTQTPGRDADPSWSPDGSQIVFRRKIDRNSNVYVMNSDGSRARAISPTRALEEKPVFSPDGQQVAFVSNRDADGEPGERYDLYLADTAGGDASPLDIAADDINTPTWTYR